MSNAKELATRLNQQWRADALDYDTALEAARELVRLSAENEALNSKLAQRVPAGMALVPCEPTLDLGWAYLDAARNDDPHREHAFNWAGYRAMIAAALEQHAKAQPVPITASVCRLEKMADGEWVPASEFFTSPEAGWDELVKDNPAKWQVQWLVTGAQIEDGLRRAFAPWLSSQAAQTEQAEIDTLSEAITAALKAKKFKANSQPAKTSKVEPLTDDALRKMHHEDQFGLFCDYDEFEQIVRATELAHGIVAPAKKGGQR